MKFTRRHRSGMTLIEIIVVIAVLGVIAAVTVPSLAGLLDMQRRGSAKELALTYNNRDSLLSDERLRTFVEWLASKPAGFMPRH